MNRGVSIMENLYINKIPAIAVRGVIPLPNNEFRIEVGREASLRALDDAEHNYNNDIVLLIQKDPQSLKVGKDDLYEYGVLAHIDLKLKLPNNNYKVKFQIKIV